MILFDPPCHCPRNAPGNSPVARPQLAPNFHSERRLEFEGITRSVHKAFATGASGGHVDNPVQRAGRDISFASNHVVFSKGSRYGDIGRAILEPEAR